MHILDVAFCFEIQNKSSYKHAKGSWVIIASKLKFECKYSGV
jgi:hypothetical protein